MRLRVRQPWVLASLAGLLGLWNQACVPAAERFCPGELDRAGSAARRIDEEWPQRPSADPVTEYVAKLGRRLLGTAADGQPPFRWRFVVLRDRSPYAFAVGAGIVYITEGAIVFSRDESQMAAFLAHEIGHQRAGHFCGSSRDGSDRREAAVGSLTQVIDVEKEMQADRIALTVLKSAGFAAEAMLEIAERLSDENGKRHLGGDRRRIAALQRQFRQTPAKPRRQASDSEFEKIRSIVASD
jgi:predicted Zn-dependent protease